MKKLFAIKHIESEGYLQLEPEAGNYIVDFEDGITTFGNESDAAEILNESIYIESYTDDGDSEEVDASEFVIVELTISKETEV